MNAASPERTIHFRARDSGRLKTATLEINIGASKTRRNTPSSMTYGRTSGPSQPGIKKIPAAWTSTIAVRPTTYGVSHFRIGWYPSRRRLTYDVRPTRIGGVRKNHFFTPCFVHTGPLRGYPIFVTTSPIASQAASHSHTKHTPG